MKGIRRKLTVQSAMALVAVTFAGTGRAQETNASTVSKQEVQAKLQ